MSVPETKRGERLAAALDHFGLANAEATLLRHNENEIYDVRANARRFALRIHIPAEGFAPLPLCGAGETAKRRAEAELLAFLSEGGFHVQRPVPGRDGRLVQALPGGIPATLLNWIEGESFDAIFHKADIPDGAAFAAGRVAGRLDAFTKTAVRRFAARRLRYGERTLPVLGARLRAAREAGVLNEEQFADLLSALCAMAPRMRAAERETGLAVCHADISGGNLIWDGADASLIDFSLSGVASPYCDLAGMFASFTRENVRKALRAGFEDGYGKRTDLRLAEPYFALGILLFICLRFEAAKDWDWFPSALERWRRETFLPLVREESFLAL
ncbi:MAG TPA: phosphotransferase [Clostridia bacterium]|nr:phosphotransferase [Clostridia bacterium]